MSREVLTPTLERPDTSLRFESSLLQAEMRPYAASLWNYFLDTHPEFRNVEQDNTTGQKRVVSLTLEEASERQDRVTYGGDKITLSQVAECIARRAYQSAELVQSVNLAIELEKLGDEKEKLERTATKWTEAA